MQHIKNIIFDLGGIFIDIDFALTEKAFTSLGVTDFNAYFTQHHASELFELLETGKISEPDFYAELRSQTGLQLTDTQIKDAWNALLLGFAADRVQWLQQIAAKYNIYLFSNTNKVHYDAFYHRFFEQTGVEDFNSLFIKAYYSHEMGLRKPYPEAFMYIINEQRLNPAETLFIDDTLKNIEGAKAVGLHTIHLVAPQTVLDLPL